MIDVIAQNLEFEQLSSTCITMRLANGAKVTPLGALHEIPTVIGGCTFLLNFLVMTPVQLSQYPVLIGRPWLYGASVITN